MAARKNPKNEPARKHQSKCWMVTSPHRHLTESEEKIVNGIISTKDAEDSRIYDFCIATEGDGKKEHTHIALRWEEEIPESLVIGWFGTGWHRDRIPEHRWNAAVDYIRKSGEYIWKREQLPEGTEDPNPEWNSIQKMLLSEPRSERKITVVVDTEGAIGKSYLTKWLCVRNKARLVPPMNEYKDIMQYLMSFPEAEWYIIDMPRGLTKTKQAEMYSGLEDLKNGHLYDTRYEGREKWLKKIPKITVFTNQEPNLKLLTPDRWNIFRVNETEAWKLKYEIAYIKDHKKKADEGEKNPIETPEASEEVKQ